MPETFQILAVRNAGEKDNPHGGKLVKWYVKLDTPTTGGEEVYVQKKPGNDLSEGMEISGRLEKGEYGWRLFPDAQQGGNFKTPTHLLATHPLTPGGPDPQAERSRRIERQHSQDMSLRLLALMLDVDRDRFVKQMDEDGGLWSMVERWTDRFAQDLDTDVGGGPNPAGASDAAQDIRKGDGATLGQSPHPAADVSAESSAGEQRPESNPAVQRQSEAGIEPAAEASPAQKSKLTQLFHAAGLNRDAMKAVVLYRCGQEKATKQGASQLIQDLMDGATHDALLAEVWDAKRAGNPLGARAAALIPSDAPWDDDGSLPKVGAPLEDTRPVTAGDGGDTPL
jgi:hypothetical protein